MIANRKLFNSVLIVTHCVCAVICESDRRAIRKRPHIILIVADDLGWNDVSFHGSNEVPTPNIDALAYNGVILNRHYTLPVCTPSRAALLTGRYPIRNGLQGWPLRAAEARALPLNNTLLPEYLKRLGYKTQLLGKWHLGYFSPNRTPTRRGFDYFFGYYNGLITYFEHWISQWVDNSTVEIGHDVHRDTGHHLRQTDRSGYFTDIITSEAVRVIREHDTDRPLFLEVSHLAIHASGDDVEPLQVRNMSEVNATFGYIKDLSRRKCAGMIKALDESVGEVVRALAAAKMLENSVVVFMSDNGAPTRNLYANSGSNYPLRGIKHTLYEGGIRGAACVFSPLIEKPGRAYNQWVHIADWLPTLYAAAGGDPGSLGQGLDGLNAWPGISHNAESARKATLLNIDEVTGLAGAVLGRYKLIQNASAEGYYGESESASPPYEIQEALSSPAGLAIAGLQGFRRPGLKRIRRLREKSTLRCSRTMDYTNCTTRCLFDLTLDPCETRDLSAQHPEIVEELEKFIDGYRAALMPQTVVPFDPQAYPENFGGFWMPWISDAVR